MIAVGVTAFVKQDSGMIAGSEGDSPEGAEHDMGDDGRGDTMNSIGESSQSGKCDEANDDEENQASLGTCHCTADLDQLWSSACGVLLVSCLICMQACLGGQLLLSSFHLSHICCDSCILTSAS